MEDVGAAITALLGLCLALVVGVWLVLVVPADMARKPGRDPLGWVLVSVFASPLTAILLLALAGPRPPDGQETR